MSEVTRRGRCLAGVGTVILWSRLLAVAEPHYPNAELGTEPLPMKRKYTYFVRSRCNLWDPATEDNIYGSGTMWRFADIELTEDTAPDESALLHCRDLLDRHRLTERIFTEVQWLLGGDEVYRQWVRDVGVRDPVIRREPADVRSPHRRRRSRALVWDLLPRRGSMLFTRSSDCGATARMVVATRRVMPRGFSVHLRWSPCTWSGDNGCYRWRGALCDGQERSEAVRPAVRPSNPARVPLG